MSASQPVGHETPTWDQFFQHSHLAWRPQKRKNSVKLSVSFCPFGVCAHKRCDEIDPCRPPDVNFINILRVHFSPIFWPKKLQSWNVTRESSAKHFCTKNALVKCWWYWPQNFSKYVQTALAIRGSYYFLVLSANIEAKLSFLAPKKKPDLSLKYRF
jgi:hypothetical protein